MGHRPRKGDWSDLWTIEKLAAGPNVRQVCKHYAVSREPSARGFGLHSVIAVLWKVTLQNQTEDARRDIRVSP